MYKEFDWKFQNESRFILTTRKDSETWFNSLCKHADRTGPTEYRKQIYGFAMPHKYKKEHIKFYENHNNRVRQYFRNRPNDFLEICWENGDGWEVLSRFLNLESPSISFPHRNQAPTTLSKAQRKISYYRKRFLSKIGLNDEN